MLKDSFGRTFNYLRLSVTDRCNFRCAYCLPKGSKTHLTKQEPELNLEEIRRLIGGFSSLGFQKVRLTGGEPTLRQDIVDIVEVIASQTSIQKVALTTNGYRLRGLLPALKAAGLNALNISLDSLNKETFQSITGSPRFDEVVASIEDAVRLGFESVKLNVVLLKDLNASELEGFFDFVRHRSVSLRFIELMKTGDNREFFERQHLSIMVLLEELSRRGWSARPRALQDGPAEEFFHPAHSGRIGLIAPYSKNFCDTCNRLRVSARGSLRLCLFGNGDISLRSWLQSDDQAGLLPEVIQNLILHKKSSHQLLEGVYGTTANLAEIGG